MTSYAGQATPPSGTSQWNRLEFAMRSILNRTATMTLVQVKAVDGLSVDVQPMVHQLDGADNAVPHGVVHGVPVWRYQGGSSAVIVDPVVGDIGIALFAHSDISSVKATKAAAPPGSRRKFSWSDAIYMGGILNGDPTQFIRMNAAGGIDIKASGAITINASDGQNTIKLTGGLVSTVGNFAAGNGVTTVAVDKNGKTLTFTNGILTGATP